jgi:hypothetical protein
MTATTIPLPVIHVARYGLDHGATRRSPVAERWPDLLRTVARQRLSGLAVAAIEGGELELTEGETAELLELHRASMIHDLGLERALLGVVEAFDAEGIVHAVLKGPAIAHSFYPDASWRGFGDLDLLVLTDDWRRACAVLDGLGYRRTLPEPRAGFDERFGKAVCYANAEGLQVDLHRTLTFGPLSLWLRPEELLARAVLFELGGRELRRLDDTAIMLHACMHASLGTWPPLLMPLRDVAQIALTGSVDWVDLGGMAERWRLRAVLRHALRSAARSLSVALPPQARSLSEANTQARERRMLAAYASGRRQRGAVTIAMVRYLPGLRDRAAFVRALLFPDRRFIEARSGQRASPSSYLRRWLTPVRWLIPRWSGRPNERR